MNTCHLFSYNCSFPIPVYLHPKCDRCKCIFSLLSCWYGNDIGWPGKVSIPCWCLETFVWDLGFMLLNRYKTDIGVHGDHLSVSMRLVAVAPVSVCTTCACLISGLCKKQLNKGETAQNHTLNYYSPLLYITQYIIL